MTYSVIAYSHFISHETKIPENSISIAKFEYDIQILLKHGYQFLSAAELHETKKLSNDDSNKTVCIIFIGGYLSDYELAFPILKKYNLHVDILADIRYMATTDENGYVHFNFKQAEEMKNSGLVSIYPLFHNFPESNFLNSDRLFGDSHIQKNIDNSSSQCVIGLAQNFTRTQCEKFISDYHSDLYFVYFVEISPLQYEKGAIPYTIIDQEISIIDIINEYFKICDEKLVFPTTAIQAKSKTDYITPAPYHTVELPIYIDVPTRNLLRNAYPMSVIAASNYERMESIAARDFIDVVFRPWYHLFDYDNHLYVTWETIQCSCINKDILFSAHLDVIDLVISGLFSGYYSDLWLDEYYIPHKPNYLKCHFSHTILIYGYDHEKMLFKALSYTNTSFYETFEVALDDVRKACSNDYFMRINLFKDNIGKPWKYDIHNIMRKLRGYLNSEYDMADNAKYYQYDKNQYWNYQACTQFSAYLKETAQKESGIHIVTLYGFLEHKRLMGWRLDYIVKRAGTIDTQLDEYHTYTKSVTKQLIALGLKFNMTHNLTIVDHMVEKINELVNNENKYIQYLLDWYDRNY